jgi:hypothetical protein
MVRLQWLFATSVKPIAMPLPKVMKFGSLQTMIPRNFYTLTPNRRFQVNSAAQLST